MKIKEVRDEFGIIRLVDEEKRKIYDYSNRKKIVTWTRFALLVFVSGEGNDCGD